MTDALPAHPPHDPECHEIARVKAESAALLAEARRLLKEAPLTPIKGDPA